MVTAESSLKPIIARAAAPMAKHRDIHTVGDLLAYWPRRYVTRESNLAALEVGQYFVGVAQVKSAVTRPMNRRRGTMLNAVITDGTHDLDITFFNARGHERALVPGARGLFAGAVGRFGQRLQLTHPGYTMLDDADDAQRHALIPIYRRIPTLHSWTVAESVRRVLDVLDEAPDPIPPPICARRDLVTRMDALRGIHTPDTYGQVERARRRLRYEEAFVLQTWLAQRRLAASGESSVARAPRVGGILEAFDARLPFALTAGQLDVGATLAAELDSSRPMHRLLQGEVGSGKTMVALRAMLQVVDAGGQAALLAPTEVLATQHHRSITAMLGDLGEGGTLSAAEHSTSVALLTGSQGAAARRATLLDIASGTAGIVIGTHALLEDQVMFADLGLAVVDEQHRFGVEQRDQLRSKGSSTPHTLVMTATPIPRTVAMTVFGDLETSTLREVPAGRAPVSTHVVAQSRAAWVARMWERVGEETRAGRSAYVVCPRIGEDDSPERIASEGLVEVGDDEDDDGHDGDGGQEQEPRELHGVLAMAAQLEAEPALAGCSIGIVHGRQGADERNATMSAFHAGEVDILVATTVIEVGVDAPNASVMVIMDADRFGVSQLHQLRGRIGRGEHPGVCFLVSPLEDGPSAERLEAVAATRDGFDLARLDLRSRREGDILGAAQHGRRTHVEFLDVLEHEDVIMDARVDASEVVAADPELAQHPVLAKVLNERLGEDRAAFLERG